VNSAQSASTTTSGVTPTRSSTLPSGSRNPITVSWSREPPRKSRLRTPCVRPASLTHDRGAAVRLQQRGELLGLGDAGRVDQDGHRQGVEAGLERRGGHLEHGSLPRV
jgi:hypothetical protein